MSIILQEQETVVNFGRTDDYAIVYTSDSTQMTKLDKKVKENPNVWSVIEEIKDRYGNLVAKKYKVPKKLISFRSTISIRTGGNPHAGEALKKWREEQKVLKEEKEHGLRP